MLEEGERDALTRSERTPDDRYALLRRFLLQEKSGKLYREEWRCNGGDYNAYREFILSCCKTELEALSSQSNRTSARPSLDSVGVSSKDSGLNSQQSYVAHECENPPKPSSYAFEGVHCVFDECKASVNIVRFAHLSSDLFAYGASDGTLSICSLQGSPRVMHRLVGHTKEITDFDWSLNNQYLCSSSLDKSVRVWHADEGYCVRVIYDKNTQICIRFHALNNNYLLVGTGNDRLKVVNFSTGRYVHEINLESSITAMDMDQSGRLLFAGDSKGCIHSITVDSRTGRLSHAHRNRAGLSHKSITTTVQFRVFSRLAGGPVLLTFNQDGSLRYFSVALEVKGYLTLRCCLRLAPLARNIRASFCPLLSLQKGEFIVSGSEDKNVYFYDFTRPKQPCVNKLQGQHAAPVVGVAWNHGETLLVSSDCEGLVIVWNRKSLLC